MYFKAQVRTEVLAVNKGKSCSSCEIADALDCQIPVQLFLSQHGLVFSVAFSLGMMTEIVAWVFC